MTMHKQIHHGSDGPVTAIASMTVMTPQATSPVKHLTPALLAFVLTAVALESTLAPSINNHLIPHLDKIAHFFIFGIIAWLIVSVLSRRLSPQSSALTAFVVVSLFGSVNEYIQTFTPGRDASLYDVVADLTGVFLFLAAWKILQITNHKSQVTVSPYAS